MIIKSQSEHATRKTMPSETEEQDGSICVLDLDLTLILEQDETLKIFGLSIEGLRLIHARLVDNITRSKKRSVPKRVIETNLFVDGKKVKLPETSGEHEPLTLRKELNHIRLQIRIPEEYAASAKSAKRISGCLRIFIPNSIVLRERFSVDFSKTDKNLRVYSPRTTTISWTLGLAVTLCCTWLLYRWSQDHDEVYQAIKFDFVLLASICSALFAYFAVPRPESVLSITTRTNFVQKIRARLKYPEFYFDHYLVAFLRSWLVILSLTIVAFLLFNITKSYRTFQLELSELGDQYVLGPKNIFSGYMSSHRATDEQSKSDVSINNINSLYNSFKNLFYTLEERLETEVEQRRDTIERSSIIELGLLSSPTQIYAKDVSDTCIYSRADLRSTQAHINSDFGQTHEPVCLATLKQSAKMVTADEVKYCIRGEPVDLLPLPQLSERVPSTNTPLGVAGLRAVAAAVIADGNGARDDWQVIPRRDRDECEYELLVTPKGSDINRYLNDHLRAHLEIDSNEIEDFDVARKYYEAETLATFVNELTGEIANNREIVNSIFPDYNGGMDRNWRLGQVIHGLSEMIEDRYSYYDVQDATPNIKSPPIDEITPVYVLSYRGEWRKDLRAPVAWFWAGLLDFVERMRIENAEGFSPNRDGVESSLREMLELNYKKVECGAVVFEKNNKQDSICNNSRGVLSDVMLVLLLIEKEILKDEQLHDAIDEYLIRGEDPMDHAIYLSLAVMLGQIGPERAKFFHDYFMTTNSEQYACTYLAAKDLAAKNKVREFNTFHRTSAREFNDC